MQDSPREEAARDCEAAAEQLEAAAQHMRTAARHFRGHEIPNACAHILAAQGHVANVEDAVRRRAQVHCEKAVP